MDVKFKRIILLSRFSGELSALDRGPPRLFSDLSVLITASFGALQPRRAIGVKMDTRRSGNSILYEITPISLS
jgi:hypothetical protein